MKRQSKIILALLLTSLAGLGPQAHAEVTGHGLAPERTESLTLVRAAPTDPDRIETLTLELDREGYNELWGKGVAVVRGFPLPGRPAVELELSAFTILRPDARLVVVDRGVERDVPRPALRHFRGVVTGDTGSLVSLTLAEGSISGFIRTRGEEFSFGRFVHSAGQPVRADLEIRNETLRAASRAPTDYCATALPSSKHDLQKTRPVAPRSTADTTGTGFLIAYVAIDSTVEWFELFGSVAGAQSQILSIMAQVSTFYENEVQIQIQVPYLRVFASELDPYDGGSMDAALLLNEMLNEWDENQTDVSRTVAHLFSVHPTGKGLAHVNVLCDSLKRPGDSQDYAVSLMPGEGGVPDRNLVAHELGHNFSSRHTHCYEPELDRCKSEPTCYEGTPVQTTGTLMSLCDSFVAEFHGRVRNEAIRPAAIAAVPLCMDIGGEPITAEDLRLSKPFCKQTRLATDDGEPDWPYYESGRTTWVKRFTPTCYPFSVTRIDAYMPEATVNRDLMLVVYTDTSGSKDPTNSTLVQMQPVTPTFVGFNEFELDAPVNLVSGDFYLGFREQFWGSGVHLIAASDWDGWFNDSYRAVNTLNPEEFVTAGSFTWMIRGLGGGRPDGIVTLDWSAKCHGSQVVQDYAIYRGQLGIYDEYSSTSCTSELRRVHHNDESGDSFFLVVPQTSLYEGSYGQNSDGVERPQADLPCKPQLVGSCP